MGVSTLFAPIKFGGMEKASVGELESSPQATSTK